MVIFVAVNLIFYVLRTNSVASHAVETVPVNTLWHSLCAGTLLSTFHVLTHLALTVAL